MFLAQTLQSSLTMHGMVVQLILLRIMKKNELVH